MSNYAEQKRQFDERTTRSDPKTIEEDAMKLLTRMCQSLTLSELDANANHDANGNASHSALPVALPDRIAPFAAVLPGAI